MDVEFWKNCGFTACTFGSNNCPIPNGSYFCTTSYLACQAGQPSGYTTKTAFLAVTNSDKANLFNQAVTVRVGASRSTAFIGDAGPVLNSPYWNTGNVPIYSGTTSTKGGCLSDLLATNLGVSNGCNSQGVPFGGPVTVVWRFGN